MINPMASAQSTTTNAQAGNGSYGSCSIGQSGFSPSTKAICEGMGGIFSLPNEHRFIAGGGGNAHRWDLKCPLGYESVVRARPEPPHALVTSSFRMNANDALWSSTHAFNRAAYPFGGAPGCAGRSGITLGWMQR